ncbi:MAG: UDP-N-acetylmuramoyl-L-alanyl-D-glutamate--2,6-diaminopimelate ligase [Legionellales bacterium RIFCSPHIGHO2_12_FULL_35_11]|nr:MAG: UDP-N-acetylmuramoyl-L-alanyl-D-glutamate--2,6-diaminopimelate ligase [Legionellales bacterium RIFCSPHIGHO2_12_FULL_35_11]
MDLISLLETYTEIPFQNCRITDIQNDSRKIKKGDLFLAYKGALADGRDFIEKAIDLGASAIGYQPGKLSIRDDYYHKVPFVAIPNLPKLLSDIAAKFYAYPAKNLKITGVTGTNGKTTIAFQLAIALELLGKNSAYIGTLGEGKISELTNIPNTTPDAIYLQKLFADYLKDNVTNVCMEVSSHALRQGRVDNIDFNQAIYTNLSHDHLDYHHTMQAYAKAKSLLFQFSSLETAILNIDDDYFSVMEKKIPKTCQRITYGFSEHADVRASNCQFSFSGSKFLLKSHFGEQQIEIKSLGLFNVYNSLAIYSSLIMSGFSHLDVVNVMGKLPPSTGRMEIVAKKPCVVIDFAHSPDALQKVLQAILYLRDSNHLNSKIWVIFGCGGDRDNLKRPVMGKIASQAADYVVLTSDNPRTEDPERIIDEIASGLLITAKALKIVDRKMAIEEVLKIASPEDIVLIAGKGHEDYQIIGTNKFKFSDKELVRCFLHC